MKISTFGLGLTSSLPASPPSKVVVCALYPVLKKKIVEPITKLDNARLAIAGKLLAIA